ncbi:MAG: hypothetical protein HYW86_03790 [Candidatus Roizmanbacteria bacterium]|nr:MAG: hypothetical protein HYW86_03790 [Candidatus Roizmanbacteria bacterium]
MAKGQFWDDTFEKLAELGASTAKKTGQAVTKTFNPLQAFEPAAPIPTPEEQQKLNEGMKNKDNHSKLDFEKLQKKYQYQDEQKEDALRQRLFQLVKNDEKEAVERNKQEKEQKEKQELQEQEEKKKKQQERIQQEQSAETPRGKERKSIFSKKKQAQKEHAEYKPSSGKQ